MTDERWIRAAELRAEGYSQHATGEAIGVSGRTIRAWESSGKLDGLAPTNGSGPEAAEDVGLSEARRRKEVALARRHELDLREREGELVQRSVVRDQLERAGEAARSAPRRLSHEAAEILGVEPRQAMELLELLVRPVLEVLREPFEGDR